MIPIFTFIRQTRDPLDMLYTLIQAFDLDDRDLSLQREIVEMAHELNLLPS
jgi:hypothetical protein